MPINTLEAPLSQADAVHQPEEHLELLLEGEGEIRMDFIEDSVEIVVEGLSQMLNPIGGSDVVMVRETQMITPISGNDGEEKGMSSNSQ